MEIIFPYIFDHWFGLPQSSVAEHTRTQKTIHTGRSVAGIFCVGLVVGLIWECRRARAAAVEVIPPFQDQHGCSRTAGIVGSPRGQRKRATAPRSARAPAE